MMTSKERAELRAQANPLDVTLIVGKGGISDTLLDEAVVLLDSHELVKGRVLETSGLKHQHHVLQEVQLIILCLYIEIRTVDIDRASRACSEWRICKYHIYKR